MSFSLPPPPSRQVDSLLLSSTPLPKAKSTIELSRQLNGLLLTPSLSVLRDRINSKEGIKDDKILQATAEQIVATLADPITGQVSLKGQDSRDRVRKSTLFIAPQPRNGRGGSDVSEAALRKRKNRKAIKLNAFLHSICLNENELQIVLEQYVNEFVDGFCFIKKASNIQKLSVAEMICIRDFTGTTTNGLLRLVRAITSLRPEIDLFPPQLKKAIVDLENTAVPMECYTVSLNVNKTTKKNCMFLRSKNPPLLLERMVASAFVAGKFQESLDVSNYLNSMLFFLGLDRGGGDTYLGVRLGNRDDGNQAEYCCYPLAVVEDASEDYKNLKATFFQHNSSTLHAYQDLINDAMHMIVVQLVEGGPNKQTTTDVQCLTVRLFPSAACVSLKQVQDQFIDDNWPGAEAAIKAGVWNRACAVRLESVTTCQESVVLSVQLLRKSTLGYVGLLLHEGDDRDAPRYAFLFERPLKPTFSSAVVTSCYLAKGFPSHDGKCALTISGQSSASCVRPCLKCIGRKEDFRKYRTWMHAHRPTAVEEPQPDEPLRSGAYRNDVCYSKFRMQTGDGMYSEDIKSCIEDKHISFSVVQEPCAIVDPLKESGGPMHISAGLIDHIIADCRNALRTIDRDGPFIAELHEFQKELEDYISKPPTTEQEHQKFYDQQYAKSIEARRKRLNMLILTQNNNNEEIRAAEADLNGLLNQRYHHASSTGFGVCNLLKKGAQEVLDVIRATLESSARLCGESEYVFNKAIELSGARFRKEHGGMSLSNSHSLLVAEHHEKIAAAVDVVYQTDPLLQGKVQKVMQVFRRLSRPAFKISIILKSQQKISVTTLDELKDAVCDFSIAFREEYPTRKPYPKLHWLECILVDYGMLHGFIGRGSEEGFESAHNRLSWVKKLLFSMPFMKDRGLKMGQRYQVSLLPEFDKIWFKLHPPTKQRGAYNVRGRNERDSKEVHQLSDGSSAAEYLQNFGLVRLSSGNYIYKSWNEKYEFAAFQSVPEEMKALLWNNPIFQERQHNQKLANLIDYI